MTIPAHLQYAPQPGYHRPAQQPLPPRKLLARHYYTESRVVSLYWRKLRGVEAEVTDDDVLVFRRRFATAIDAVLYLRQFDWSGS